VDYCNASFPIRHFGRISEEKEEILLAGSKCLWEADVTV
jgi:hypothetical protein